MTPAPPKPPVHIIDTEARIGVAEVRTMLESHQDICSIIGAQTRDEIKRTREEIGELRAATAEQTAELKEDNANLESELKAAIDGIWTRMWIACGAVITILLGLVAFLGVRAFPAP